MSTVAEVVDIQATDAQAIHTHLTTIHAAVEANQWDLPYEPVLDAIVAVRKESCTTDGDTSLAAVLTAISGWDGAPGGGYGLLVDVVRSCPAKDMVFNALWALNSYTCHALDNWLGLVNLGVIPLFIEKLSDKNMDVVEQACVGLGNVTGVCAEFRDSVHQAGGVAAAVNAVRNPLLPVNGRRNITRAMSYIARTKPPLRIEHAAELMVYFTNVCALVVSSREAGEVDDEDVAREIINTLWAISFLTEGDSARAQMGVDVLPLIVAVLSVPAGSDEPGQGDAPVVERLVPCEQMAYAMEYLPRADLERLCMLNSDIWNCCVCTNRRLYNRVRSGVCHNQFVRIPAIRIIGNVMADEDTSQAAIDCGVLRVMEGIVSSLDPAYTTVFDMDSANEWKELCWILSNVATGTDDQIRLILQSSVFYNFVMEAMQMKVAPNIGKEAASTVVHALMYLPEEVPLGWVAAAFAYTIWSPLQVRTIDSILYTLMSLMDENRPTILNFITSDDNPTTNRTPEGLLLQAATFTRTECVGGSTVDKVTPLMRNYVLPTMCAAGRLHDNKRINKDNDDGDGDGVEGERGDTDTINPPTKYEIIVRKSP